MSLRTRSRVLFVLAGLLLAAAAACASLWRDQQQNAEESARMALTEGDGYLESKASFEKNAREWRLLAIVGGVLGGAALAGGMVYRRK